MVYGEEHAVYGTKACQLCGHVHDPRFHLKESSASRFKLIQLAAELNSIDPAKDKVLADQKLSDAKNVARELEGKRLPHETDAAFKRRQALEVFRRGLARRPDVGDIGQGPVPHRDAADWKAMLGLLITPNGIYATAAGTFRNNETLQHVIRKKKYKTCIKPCQTSSIHGLAISKPQFGTPPGAKEPNVPGSCAAPRLIGQWIEDAKKNKWTLDKGRSLEAQGWAMSEIYFLPNTAERFKAMYPGFVELRVDGKTAAYGYERDKGLYWLPGLTAHSCDTCERVVPLLLCPGAAG